MYSAEIVSRRLYQAKKAGIEVHRLPRDKSIEIAGKLEKLRFDERGTKGPPGWLSRPLNAEEQKFIVSEQVLCKVDFQYFAERYCQIGIDTGTTDAEQTIGPIVFQESQKRLLKALGIREEEVHAEYAKYKTTEGIRVIAHKTRQQYYTAICRMLTLHRMLFWSGTRALAAALNPKGVGELYKRDMLAIERLPWWLAPDIYPNVKDEELGFRIIDSRLMYQAENEKSGLAVGTTVDVSHLTEVPLWQYPEYNIGFSLMAAIPRSRMTIHIQEGTSAGPGYWKEISESCRNKETGFESWTYVFIPWYFNSRKFVKIPPPGWAPAPHTLEHAALIERTSAEWNYGQTIRASIEQLAWWETERDKYVRENQLGKYLATYPATPEQSFTAWGRGALPTELIEKMEQDERDPMMYGVEVVV